MVPVRILTFDKKMSSASENAVSQSAEGLDISGGCSLVSRLRLDPARDADFVPLPVQLLRKYIAYARTFVFPR